MGRIFAMTASLAVLCGASASASGTAQPAGNAIVRENALAGSSDWQRPQGGDIEVYGTQIGGLPGDAVALHVSTAFHYRIAIYRLGWYGGAGARQVACLPGCNADEQGVVQP